MKHFVLASLAVLTFASTALIAQDGPPQAKPEKEHEWLQQFVGEWDLENEAVVDPSKPPMKCKGTESVRSIGGMWIVSEMNSKVMDQTMTGIMSVGYDPQKKKYIGTWLDSSNTYLWKYEGTVDATGKVLTLEAEGPSFTNPGKTSKYKDVTEFKSKDHKVLTSWVQGDDGKWTSFMTGHGHRRKK